MGTVVGGQLKNGTINEIVFEKCSSLLNGSKVIVSKQKDNVLNKIKKNISKNSSSKFFFGKDYSYKKNKDGFIYKDKIGKLNLPKPNLLGDFQISNISTAINVVRNIDKFNITESHIKRAITKIRSEGRLQIIKNGKLRKYVKKNNIILVDGAHNVLAATVVNKYLGNFNKKRKIIMVLGMMANKEHKKFIKTFKNRVSEIITLDIPNQINFIKKEKLSKIVRSCGIPTKIENSIKLALKNIGNENDEAIIFFTGSLYFAGEVLNLN